MVDQPLGNDLHRATVAGGELFFPHVPELRVTRRVARITLHRSLFEEAEHLREIALTGESIRSLLDRPAVDLSVDVRQHPRFDGLVVAMPLGPIIRYFAGELQERSYILNLWLAIVREGAVEGDLNGAVDVDGLGEVNMNLVPRIPLSYGPRHVIARLVVKRDL